MNEHSFRYRVELYDANAFGEASSCTLLRFMQQAASQASAALGFDPAWYERNGTFWVIRRTVLEQQDPARYLDEVVVRTEVLDIRRVRSQRAYELRRAADDRLLARGWSDWVYYDAERGRPARPPADMQKAFMPGGVQAQPRHPRRESAPPAHAFHSERRVELATLDTVAHVNNARYADAIEQDLWDALAEHGWQIDPQPKAAHPLPAEHDLEYLAEARYRDRLQSATWVTALDAHGFRSEHLLSRNGERILHAASRWRWSAGRLPESLRAALARLHG